MLDAIVTRRGGAEAAEQGCCRTEGGGMRERGYLSSKVWRVGIVGSALSGAIIIVTVFGRAGRGMSRGSID